MRTFVAALVAVAALWLIAGCATQPMQPGIELTGFNQPDPDAEPLIPRGGDLPEPSETGINLEIVRVFYATDRAATGNAHPSSFYGSARSAGLQYGVCTVSIPPGHRRGKLEEQRWTHLEYAPDVNKHVVLLRVSSFTRDRFFDSLRNRIGESRGKRVLVFIHGYRVPFSVAVRRTAQIAFDMSFDGVPILYSWPSHGALEQYPGDEGNAEWTAPHLEQFLREVARDSGAEKIHVVAHSMGNRPLVNAVSKIAVGLKTPFFEDLVLTAPDVDVDIFRRAADSLRTAARRVTLYASSNDKALQVSRVFHSNQPRAGEAGQHLVVVPNVDTVDVSELETGFFALGHSYTAENALALTDMRELIIERKSPVERGLARLLKASAVFWKYPTPAVAPR